MNTAIAYLRVSTTEQATEGVSLDAQRAKVEAWCLLNDYELISVYTDEGISGSKMTNRPGLLTAVDEACKTKSALIVYSLSRLSRSTRDTMTLGDKLDKAGSDLVSLSEKIDTTTAAGKMVFRLLAVMAEFERDQISERTQEAMDHKKRKGERLGVVAFGWDVATNGVQLVRNEFEQGMIDRMREMRSQGASFQSICDEMGRLGVRTKTGNAVWKPQTVKNLIVRVEVMAA